MQKKKKKHLDDPGTTWDFDPHVNFSNITVDQYNNSNETHSKPFNNTLHPFEETCETCTDTCCKSPYYTGENCTCLEKCGPCDFCSSPWHIAPLPLDFFFFGGWG